MKKTILEFVRRGLSVCGLGPIVLAVLYLILRHEGLVETLTVSQVCRGIFSLTALAFVAGGINVIYQMERMPLMVAVLLHGCVLYGGYLGTYLLNDWLEWGEIPVLVFSAIFILGYFVIWVIIYSVIRRDTAKVNEILRQKQQDAETA